MTSSLLRFRRAIILATILLALAALAVIAPFDQWVMSLQTWAQKNPSYALFVVTVFIAASFTLLLPASVPMMLAGLMFGLAKGMAVVWVAGLVASTLSFLLARTLGRDWLVRLIRRQGLFTLIDRAVERKGFMVVLLLRASLLPFPWLNYALGLTSVRLNDYLAGTAIGMLAPYFLFVYLGTTFGSLTALLGGEIELSREQWIAGAAAGAIALVLIAVVLRGASRALRRELNQT